MDKLPKIGNLTVIFCLTRKYSLKKPALKRGQAVFISCISLSDAALSDHSVRNLKETGDISTDNEVVLAADFSSCFINSVEDVLHDALELSVNFLE